jgi:acylpyruvate hydrolase
VTLDEVDLGTGALRTVVNGKVEQRADLRDLIFPIPELVSTLSEFTELHPGDLILTGTPGGVGYRREPQLSLHPGDVVTVEIDGVGSITNRVEAERVSTS